MVSVTRTGVGFLGTFTPGKAQVVSASSPLSEGEQLCHPCLFEQSSHASWGAALCPQKTVGSGGSSPLPACAPSWQGGGCRVLCPTPVGFGRGAGELWLPLPFLC